MKKLVDKPHNLENQKNLRKGYVKIHKIYVDTSSLFYHYQKIYASLLQKVEIYQNMHTDHTCHHSQERNVNNCKNGVLCSRQSEKDKYHMISLICGI